MKVKRFHDARRRVVGYLAARATQGRVGALEAELDNGVRFAVGTGLSDAERDAPPPLGGIITFRYQELTDGGVPALSKLRRHPRGWPGNAARRRPRQSQRGLSPMATGSQCASGKCPDGRRGDVALRLAHGDADEGDALRH